VNVWSEDIMDVDQSLEQPVIATDLFDLRQIRRSDRGLIELYAGQERVARMMCSIPHPMPPGSVDAFIARAASPERVEDVWIIDGLKSGGAEVMGLVALEHMGSGQSKLGYWVVPVFWNTGLASRAVAALLEANPQGCRSVFATVFQDNPASARVLIRNGFDYLGDAEAFSVARNATVRTWTYSRKL
jgi:RimJ/RimL family protein N-acetyltransferase